MYLEIFPADFAVFRVFWGISWDFAEIPEFRGSATARNIRSPECVMLMLRIKIMIRILCGSIVFISTSWKITGISDCRGVLWV